MGMRKRPVSGSVRAFPAFAITMLASALLMLQPLSGQSTVGRILGTVMDSSGAVIARTAVTVINTDTSVSRMMMTDDSGNYQFPSLLPGRYSLSAEQKGFRKAVVTGIVLQVNQEARYDLHMELGELAQEVKVSAEGIVQVQADDATLGQVVDQKKIEELPLNGRNFLQLLTIGSGAAPILQNQGGAITGETKRE